MASTPALSALTHGPAHLLTQGHGLIPRLVPIHKPSRPHPLDNWPVASSPAPPPPNVSNHPSPAQRPYASLQTHLLNQGRGLNPGMPIYQLTLPHITDLLRSIPCVPAPAPTPGTTTHLLDQGRGLIPRVPTQ